MAGRSNPCEEWSLRNNNLIPKSEWFGGYQARCELVDADGCGYSGAPSSADANQVSSIGSHPCLISAATWRGSARMIPDSPAS